jgi:ribonuclease III
MSSDTNPERTPEDLQNVIGYAFHNKKILNDALTRRAFQNENPGRVKEFMDPLATLGDAVLDTIVVFKLFDEDDVKDKEKLTKDKIENVKREKICKFATNLQLEKYILWGKGEDQDKIWIKGSKAFDTITEAIIGAVYLDAQKNGKNGMAIVRDMLKKLEFFNKTK